MYRDFATRKARGLGIVGEVENMRDGTVRVVSEGDHPHLQAFITKLRRGSVLAHVEKLDVKTLPATGEFTTFTLIR